MVGLLRLHYEYSLVVLDEVNTNLIKWCYQR